jgi:23S rRNA pseudoU1915 N3-methylase RlmH
MKIHIITIGEPKLAYAKQGWEEYSKRLGRFHQLRVSHLANKYTNNSGHILATAGSSYRVVLEIQGRQFGSQQLATKLDELALRGGEVCFILAGGSYRQSRLAVEHVQADLPARPGDGGIGRKFVPGKQHQCRTSISSSIS